MPILHPLTLLAVAVVAWLLFGAVSSMVQGYRKTRQRGERRPIAVATATLAALPIDFLLYGIACLTILVWKVM